MHTVLLSLKRLNFVVHWNGIFKVTLRLLACLSVALLLNASNTQVTTKFITKVLHLVTMYNYFKQLIK